MRNQDLTVGFQNVDRSDTDFLIQFLVDANRTPSAIEAFKTQLDLLSIQAGDHVLDIGCGIGERAMQMAKFVGHTGKVVGTDLSSAMVDASIKRTGESALPLEFYVANACEQPFLDASFDKIRIERVLMYIKDVATAFGEFRRLLKDDGKLLILDFDWDAMVFAHTDTGLTRKIVEFVSDSFPNGRVGANLFGLFKDHGFRDVVVKPIAYLGQFELTNRVIGGVLETAIKENVFSAAELESWWAALVRDDAEGKYFMAYQGFIVTGTK